MKRVASEKDLTRLALQTGAVVNFDGRAINKAAQRMDMPRAVPVAPPAPAPEPAPPPPTVLEATIDTAGLERAAVAGRQSTEKLHALVTALVAEIKAQRDASPAPVKEWRFKFERDDKDRLDAIVATAIR